MRADAYVKLEGKMTLDIANILIFAIWIAVILGYLSRDRDETPEPRLTSLFSAVQGDSERAKNTANFSRVASRLVRNSDAGRTFK
jgi:hypothetical protein